MIDALFLILEKVVLVTISNMAASVLTSMLFGFLLGIAFRWVSPIRDCESHSNCCDCCEE